MQECFVAGSQASATSQTIIYPMEVRRSPGRDLVVLWEVCNHCFTPRCEMGWSTSH